MTSSPNSSLALASIVSQCALILPLVLYDLNYSGLANQGNPAILAAVVLSNAFGRLFARADMYAYHMCHS